MNDIIKHGQEAEVQKLGKEYSARRPLQPAEFEYTMSVLLKVSDTRQKYMVSTAATFQFHMMAQVDDTCRFDQRDLKPHPQFAFALQARMCWSKNVREERDAPDQIVMGCMDVRYCVLLALGIYL